MTANEQIKIRSGIKHKTRTETLDANLGAGVRTHKLHTYGTRSRSSVWWFGKMSYTNGSIIKLEGEGRSVETHTVCMEKKRKKGSIERREKPRAHLMCRLQSGLYICVPTL